MKRIFLDYDASILYDTGVKVGD